jgi:uncharacterized Zn finger protein
MKKYSIVYECLNCGTVISINSDNPKQLPSKCSCGETKKFKFIAAS